MMRISIIIFLGVCLTFSLQGQSNYQKLLDQISSNEWRNVRYSIYNSSNAITKQVEIEGQLVRVENMGNPTEKYQFFDKKNYYAYNERLQKWGKAPLQVNGFDKNKAGLMRLLIPDPSGVWHCVQQKDTVANDKVTYRVFTVATRSDQYTHYIWLNAENNVLSRHYIIGESCRLNQWAQFSYNLDLNLESPQAAEPLEMMEEIGGISEMPYLRPGTRADQFPVFQKGDIVKFWLENAGPVNSNVLINGQNRVLLAFTITADGRIKGVNAMGIHGCSINEAKRLVNATNGYWTPARSNGINIDCVVRLQITFEPQDKNHLCALGISQEGVITPPDPEKTYDTGDLSKDPEFPGGEAAYLAYLGDNLSTPKEARKAKATGTAVCSFDIDETGKIMNITVVKDPGLGMGKALLEMLRTMPAWIPGEYLGTPVKVRYTVPVRFK